MAGYPPSSTAHLGKVSAGTVVDDHVVWVEAPSRSPPAGMELLNAGVSIADDGAGQGCLTVLAVGGTPAMINPGMDEVAGPEVGLQDECA
jgi:hypothetical protein